MVNYTEGSDVLINRSVHFISTPGAQLPAQPAQPARYTAQQLAARYPDLGKGGKPLGEGAIRTRWWSWISQVAPELLLKDSLGYTDLAAELFDDFAQRVKREGMKPEVWVLDAKARYSAEWENAGVIEGELMPSGVGEVLALTQTTASNLTQQGEDRKAKLLKLIQQTRSAESNLSQTQRAIAEQRGVNQAIDEFEIELEAKLQTLSELRQALNG